MDGDLYRAAEEDLINFAGSRLPICLCLDVSNSMNAKILDKDGKVTTKIAQLNEEIRKFYGELKRNEMARYTVEVAIVTFGGGLGMGQSSEVKKIRDFSRVDIQGDAPELSAFGLTPLGEAISMSLELVEKKKKHYRCNGTTFYRPWLIIVSGGGDFGSLSKLEFAREVIHECVERKKIVPMLFTVGEVTEEEKETLLEFGNGCCFPFKDFLNVFRKLFYSGYYG